MRLTSQYLGWHDDSPVFHVATNVWPTGICLTVDLWKWRVEATGRTATWDDTPVSVGDRGVW